MCWRCVGGDSGSDPPTSNPSNRAVLVVRWAAADGLVSRGGEGRRGAVVVVAVGEGVLRVVRVGVVGVGWDV